MSTTRTTLPLFAWPAAGLLAVLAADAGAAPQGTTGPAPFRVTVKDEQAIVSAEPVLPIDPQRRINYQPQGLLAGVSTESGGTLHLGVSVSVNYDGQVLFQG